ncbi:FkbM family methyltransferase [Patescibacteria group bacterium]|nr:FkbM family methyltransferase [Patescibacteria group bacterium]
MRKVKTPHFDMYLLPGFESYYCDDFEPLSVSIFNSIIKNGNVVVDVGAHFGYFTLLASKKTDRVYAIEPVKKNNEVLRQNIVLNNSQAIVFDCAISDRLGKKKINVATSSDCSGFYVHPFSKPIDQELVSVKTLDDLFHNKRIDLLKVDTEGNEYKVLMGMESVLLQNSNLKLLFEFNPKCLICAGDKPSVFLETLKQHNYSIFFIDDKSQKIENYTQSPARWSEMIDEDACVNLLCVRTSDPDYNNVLCTIDTIKRKIETAKTRARSIRFTIGITVYNRKEYLEECVESALSQTYKPDEIIIVDDFSQDKGVIDILEKYRNRENIKLIYNKENLGIAGSWNTVLDNMSSEWLVMLDGDDVLEKNALEEITKYIALHNEIEFISTLHTIINSKGETLGVFDRPLGKDPKKLILEGMYLSHLKVFNKMCFEKVGSFRGKIAVDYDMVVRVLEMCKMGMLHKCLYKYRFHEDSCTKKRAKEQYEKGCKILLGTYKRQMIDENLYIDSIIERGALAHSTNLGLQSKITQNIYRIKELTSKIVQETAEKERIDVLYNKEAKSHSTDLNSLEWRLGWCICNPLKAAKKIPVFVDYVYAKRKKDIIWAKNNPIRCCKKYLKVLVSKGKTCEEDLERSIYDSLTYTEINIDKWSEDTPLISVIIPCYNYGNYISEALNSIFAQTLQDFEVIIIDDGSTDPGTEKELKTIKHPKVQVIFQENSGVSNARNKGISKAKGKYICCLDPDDILDPTYFEKCLLVLERDAQLGLAYSWVKEIGARDILWKTTDLDIDTLLSSNHVPISAIFRKEIADSVFFDPDIRHEDWDFWLSVVGKGWRGKVIPEVLMYSKRHGNNKSLQDEQFYKETLLALKEKHKNLLKKDFREKVKEEYIKKIALNPFTNLNRSVYQEKHKKRVFVVVPFLICGGAETLLYNFASKLKNEVDFTFISVIKSKNEWEDRFKGISSRVYHLPKLFESKNVCDDFLLNYIQTRNIDVLHFFHCGYFYDILPIIGRKFSSLKIVVTLFNSYVDHFVDATKYHENVSMYTSDNQATISTFKKLGVSEEKLQLLPNAIDPFETYNPATIDRENERKKIGVKENEIAVFFIGRLSEEKNPDVFLKIARQVVAKKKNVKFFVVGDGNMKKEIMRMIKRIGSANITYLGYRSDIPNLLTAADIFVLPSRIEGFPSSMLEAMATENCVIASDVGAVGDVIEDGKTGFVVNKKDYRRFVERILQLVDSRETIVNMGRKAREVVVQNYTTEKLANNYRKLYSNEESSRFGE